ncbi:hypothetical protein COY87_05095 [Candidatus Roizmanbacteria bacterium CG_4_10_14_0_8_um_filter_33_9]|uniref:Uncharacterized protein n=1 Tax=Candidatus Roizmanbacteria bacterium CG_4_10_14_0_8_um_filter_33_9 TaxID=1974826 RepID=A0A2M7QI30_9BACT|nr:MAG: hypothetical protein COY87_05095 [Candidatus Roizmanbacteria bacterium CG_4_10_14_0_8_um_filter_33_9]
MIKVRLNKSSFVFFMKSILKISFIIVVFLALSAPFSPIYGQPVPTPTTDPKQPLPCSMAPAMGSCPIQLVTAYQSINERCVVAYDEFIRDPITTHFWALDEEITAQGKADERARQFVYWVINNNSIDDHPVIKQVWNITRNVTLFLFVLVVSMFGLGYIIGQRSQFQSKIEIWPNIMKILLGLLYISFSFAITIFIIQVSEILMKFFIETLGGKNLFNIYFSQASTEKNYTDFIGCRDLNHKVQEAANTEMFMLKLTNITYYVMGIMLLLRKIILWFLMFVSPFLVLLMPFVFIRNTGYIWIGVFFQWVFYGPLFALFLGALSSIWKNGIPYPFDFSRAGNMLGYVYPTGINIVYGGPGQIGSHIIGALNNANYADTFAEYIISLVMLWAVTFFPWWLLRIFRDTCCDGIYAMKNILMGMFDKMGGGGIGPKPPPSGPTPTPSTTSTSLQLPHDIDEHVQTKVHIETIEQIRRSKTEEIHKSLDLSMTKLTDIARFETNKQTRETVQKNLNFLSQPTKAETPTERQKFMNIRTELFNRSIKEDRVAQQMLSSISNSSVERNIQKERILSTIPQSNSFTQTVASQTHISQDKVASLSNSFITSVLNNNSVINHVSQTSNTPITQVKTILSSYQQHISQPITQNKSLVHSTTSSQVQSPTQIINSISKQTGIQKEQIKSVITNVSNVAKSTSINNSLINSVTSNNSLVNDIATKTNISAPQIQTILSSYKEHQTQNISNPVQSISNKTGIQQNTISSVISQVTNLAQTQTTGINTSFIETVANNKTVVNDIATKTNISAPQVQTILSSYKEHQVNSDKAIQNISQKTGVSQEKIKQVMSTVNNVAKNNKDVIKTVALKENVKEEDIIKILDTQNQLVVEPEKHIEETVSIPPSVSIEDYEEVKKMWTSQYEKGEVPVTENITSRDEWVENDITFITNTLNKLMSPDEKLKQQGVDDLGYILPIFLINNLKGEELVIYLKAKIEAAKHVKELRDMEKQITEKLKAKASEEEELVEVEKPKEEEQNKPLEMHMEMDENQNKPQEKTLEEDTKENNINPDESHKSE